MNEWQRAQVAPALNQLLGADNWNVDLTDCDKVLRVEAGNDVSAIIIRTLYLHGFSCANMI